MDRNQIYKNFGISILFSVCVIKDSGSSFAMENDFQRCQIFGRNKYFGRTNVSMFFKAQLTNTNIILDYKYRLYYK